MRRQREAHFNTQSLVVEVIDHVEQPDAAPVLELVIHKVHRPDFVQVSGTVRGFGFTVPGACVA